MDNLARDQNPARQEMRKPIWKWLVILGISAALPLICATTLAPYVERVAFNGEHLDVDLGGILPDLARIDLLITESEHGLDTDGSGSLTPSSFINEERYRQFILGGEGHELITLAESLRYEASIDSNRLPELDSEHLYYLVAITQHKGSVRIIDFIDISKVLLKHKTYKVWHAPNLAEIVLFLLLGLAALLPIALVVLIVGAFLVRARKQPTWDAPEDRP
jgi:hypothetical protein